MRKVILSIAVLSLATSVVAQGTVNYSIRVSGSLAAHVYGLEIADPGVARSGNTSSETPPGTQSYTGVFLTGSGWSAQLFAANGASQPENSLIAVPNSITSFRTGLTLGGTIAPNSALEIPGVPEGGTGTFQLRVWDNVGGMVSSWTQAQPLWESGTIAAGKSTVFDVSGLGTELTFSPPMVNFRSFNVYMIPEPGTFALVGLGAAALLLFRRRSIFNNRSPL